MLALRPFPGIASFIPSNPPTFPMFQIGKLRLREVKYLA